MRATPSSLPRQLPTPFLPTNARVICVSKAETHARIDAKILRGLGVPQPRWFASGLEAARHLAEHGADLVLVDDACREMSGLEFVRLIRLHPKLALVPVLALSTDARSSTVLHALAAGCSGFCVRPYAPEHLLREGARAMQRAPVLGQEIAAGLNEQSLSETAFSAKLASLETIQSEIEQAFRPVAEPPAPARCPASQHRRLASEWKAQGRPDKVREHLQEGAKALASHGEYREAWNMLDPLRQAHPQVEPALVVAEQCVQDDAMPAAAGLFEQALRRKKRPAQVYAAARRACCFTAAPQETAKRLASAMVRAGAGESAPDIYLEIMGESSPVVERKAPRKGLFSKLPALHDVVVVAKHTLDTYRNGGLPEPVMQEATIKTR